MSSALFNRSMQASVSRSLRKLSDELTRFGDDSLQPVVDIMLANIASYQRLGVKALEQTKPELEQTANTPTNSTRSIDL